jgi:hypothetical protein
MTWLLTKGRVPYLVVLAMLTAWLLSEAAQVGVERNNESLNTRDAAQTALYERFKATFGSDEDLLLAVAHPRLLEAEGLRLLADATEHIARIDAVRRVYSLTNAKQIVAGDVGADLAPLVEPPFDAPGVGDRLRAALDRNPELAGLFVSGDRKTAGVLIEIEDRPGDDQYRADLIDALRELIAAYRGRGADLHLTGIAVQKHDVGEFVHRDQILLMPLAVAVLAVVLASFFRSVLGVVLPLAVTGVTLAWTLGAYHLAGLEVNAITALLPPILMVLSLAVSIHLIQGWLDAPPTPGDRVARIRSVVRALRYPCFFCSLTTALGFGSLVASGMPAVQQFGVFAALGTMLSFAVGMTLVPIGLTFVEPPATKLATPQHRLLRRVLEWAAEEAAEHPWRVLTLFGAITAVSVAGIPAIRNNTDLVRFLRSDAPLYRDTMFIDRHLTGANTLEYLVSRRDGEPLTGLDDVRRLAAFEKAVLAVEHVTGVSSVLAVLRQMQRAEHGGAGPELPDNERDAAYAFDLLEAAPEQDLLRKMIAPDFTLARVNVRIHAIGTSAAAPLAESIERDARRIFGAAYDVAVTGAFYHVVQDSNHLVRSQVKSFALALALVSLAIGLSFRSAVLTWIAMIPNVMPIAWTAGLMGAFGIDLSTGTAMIASAVLGLVVDDTIHYLTHFHRVLQGDPVPAVRRTTTGVGAALVMNNLVLVLGFWVGCFGSFKPTIYFSLLSGLTMISALLCDLLVTPACLVLHYRRRAPVRACAV